MSRSLARGLSRLCLLGIILCCSSLAVAGDKAHWQNPRYLVESFVEIALHREYSPNPSPVRKWTTPVKYHLVHHTADRELHTRLIATHFNHLAAITGLAIGPAKNQEDANFLVVLASENELKRDLLTYFGWNSESKREAFFREAVCLGSFSTNRHGAIISATTIIPVDRARGSGALVSCIVEELTQVLGLPNDSVKVFPSVFNDKSTDAYLSGLDYLLLKMLYDNRVKIGMDEKAARPILQTIATEYERDGLFDTAERTASESGLSAMIP
ncbi:MAG: DUF2927 domain-containing protein [Sulfuritalea sp.]|nr:DUF2927 domain-containing protein [Sulfuritalea sp.]